MRTVSTVWITTTALLAGLLLTSMSASQNEKQAEVAEEVGDLLFAAVNVARFVKVDPEAHLRAATEKFRRRFDRMAAMLRAGGRSPESAGLPELDRLWRAAKREEKET